MQAEKEVVQLTTEVPVILNQNTNPNLAQFPVKKPTRQWAAWTHQEEESFFTALRQVGKNFQKITYRVESKNKDQVRHYYYRLVRRMNKLLGPEVILDAKNPKDTNSAMLRWWSLLEKYSCKASKLHLKPRRFKLFIEALEQQLLKDRRKSIRKRVCQGENSSPERGLVSRPFKVILCDGENVKKSGPVGRTPNKQGGSSSLGEEKEGKQRRKQVYRRWEKAAIDGVSLVADAAEHLERTSILVQDKSPLSLCDDKLKLQLFPIDELTRTSLETDKHNPHLELTVKFRKKISSILKHLNQKWGSSSCAVNGELMLFPYTARKETLTSHQRWTHDSVLSAVEVHSFVGSPSVFRLRYGWFERDGSVISRVPNTVDDNMNVEQATPFEHAVVSAGEWADSLTNISIGDLLLEASSEEIDSDCCADPQPVSLLRDVPFASDSFDAAIAAHILRHQNNNKSSSAPMMTCSSSSIWDDEDTRDAFSFRKTRLAESNVASCRGIGRVNGETSKLEAISGDEGPSNPSDQQGDPMEEGPMDSLGKIHCGLADVYWPDSLGPLDLDMRSSKYNEDLILSDSLGSLSRLIATSLDAFQNCSLFGFENKKDKSNMV